MAPTMSFGAKGSGTVYTQTDYDVWRAHFGESAGPGASSGAAAVPEPAAWMLLMYCRRDAAYEVWPLVVAIANLTSRRRRLRNERE